ncbi:MAG TPA: hypothetical protein DEQ02_08145 [Ruminococcaceae bacterium]|nr:hypothetical protein [Oscillospiraceae bacterium]
MTEFWIDYKITGTDSLNSIYSGKHFSNRKNYVNAVKILVASQMKRQIRKKIYKNPVIISISFPEDRLDIDNHSYFSKCVIDSLKGYLIADDGPKHVYGVVQVFDAKLKRILVQVSEFDGEENY